MIGLKYVVVIYTGRPCTIHSRTDIGTFSLPSQVGFGRAAWVILAIRTAPKDLGCSSAEIVCSTANCPCSNSSDNLARQSAGWLHDCMVPNVCLCLLNGHTVIMYFRIDIIIHCTTTMRGAFYGLGQRQQSTGHCHH